MPIVWQRLLAARSADHRVVSAKVPEVLRVLWLEDVVTYPGAVLPLEVTKSEDVAVIEAALAGDGLLLAVTLPHAAGVVMRVVDAKPIAGGHSVLLVGIERRTLAARMPGGAAATMPVWTVPLPDVLAAERTRRFRVAAMHWARACDERAAATIAEAEVPEQLVDFVVAHLDLPTHERQRILHVVDLSERMDAAEAIVDATTRAARNPPNPGTPECPEHGAVAIGECKRCGAFVCSTCLGERRDARLCRACRLKERPAPPSLSATQARTLALPGIAALLLVGAGWYMGGDRSPVGTWVVTGFAAVSIWNLWSIVRAYWRQPQKVAQAWVGASGTLAFFVGFLIRRFLVP